MPSAIECGFVHGTISSAHNGRRELGPAVGAGVERPRPRPYERRTTFGLDGVEPSSGSGGAEARCESPAADLHEDAIEVVDPGAGELIADLPADRAAAVEGEGVLRALHGEGDGAVGDGLAEAEHRGVARRVGGPTFAAVDACAEPVEFVAEAGSHPRRHEHVDRPVGCLRQRRGGERGVAARGDRERRAGREVAELLGGSEVEQDREEVARLLAAAHSPGLVLHPDAAAVGEAECVGQRIGPSERRRPEPGAGDIRDRCVELTDKTAAGLAVHPVGVGVGGPGELVVVAHVRVGVLAQLRIVRWLVALDDLQDVAAVVRRRVGAAPRERRGDVDGRRTHGTAPAGDAHRCGQPATRALKSSIMSSHTST
jgi:hypothetical protein